MNERTATLRGVLSSPRLLSVIAVVVLLERIADGHLSVSSDGIPTIDGAVGLTRSVLNERESGFRITPQTAYDDV